MIAYGLCHYLIAGFQKPPMPLPFPASALLSRIPMAAQTILDVGCGHGELAAAFRCRNPKARLLGIEIDPAAAALAEPHLNALSRSDVEVDPLPFDAPDGIDCIIYNGVLPFLCDPSRLIRRHIEALSPDGLLLICQPNLDYWRRIDRRLRGVWDDSDPRLLSQQHGDWLTQAGITDNLHQAGLTVSDVTMAEADSASAKWFAEALAPGLAALGIDATDFARRTGASHMIWRARKHPVQPLILSSTMLVPVGGVSHVRVVHPIEALGTDPAVTAAVRDSVELRRPTDGIPRIFIMHRPALLAEQGMDTLRTLTEGGHLAITEFDDHPAHFPMMQVGGELSFIGVHAIQTTTSALADVLRQYNPEVAVFPNAIVSLPDVRNFADSQSITLFFGALNRERDWPPFMPVLNAVARQAGDRLKFQVVHDQAFFDALETPHKTFTPTCDYETYLTILGGSDISFMPLSDTAFNRAKSDLKFIEAGACRVAPLSSTVVYSNSIEDGRTGLLFRDPAELHARLLRLIGMPELAHALGDAARAYVAEHRMLAYQIAARIAWYRSLWDRREALEAARDARMSAWSSRGFPTSPDSTGSPQDL